MKLMKKILLFFLSIALLSSYALAANTISITSPDANEWIAGTSFLLNASMDTNTDDVTNVTFYYRPIADTGTWTLIENVHNVTGQQTQSFNTTWSTTGFIDANNYSINATGYNDSGYPITSAKVNDIHIDNGAPTATLSSYVPSQYETIDHGTAFTMGVDADNTIGITGFARICDFARKSRKVARKRDNFALLQKFKYIEY